MLALASIWVTQSRLGPGTLQGGPPAAEMTVTSDATATATFTPEPDGVDNSAPQLLSIEFESTEVNTTSSSQTLTLTAHIIDDLSGLKYAQLRFQPRGSTQYFDFFVSSDLRIAGDRRDGLYRTSAILPKYAAHGRWSLMIVALNDQVNNSCAFSLFYYDTEAYQRCIAVEGIPYFINGQDDEDGFPIVTEPITADPMPIPIPETRRQIATSTPQPNTIYLPALGE